MRWLCAAQESAAACCAACGAASAQGCNVWVWCGNAAGCGGRKHKECWLKKQQGMRLTHIAGGRGAQQQGEGQGRRDTCIAVETAAALASLAEHAATALCRRSKLLVCILLHQALPAHPICCFIFGCRIHTDTASFTLVALCTCPLSCATGTNWTSGALYDDAARTALLATEQARLEALRSDAALPLVYMDVAIQGKPAGRIHFVLFTKQSPRAAENFRQLCTGVVQACTAADE